MARRAVGGFLRATAALQLDRLSVAYDGQPAVDEVSHYFAPGSLTAITGPNGAGKSSLLKAALAILPPAGGQVTTEPPTIKIAYLPQQHDIDRSFPISVRDAVLFGYWPRLGWHLAADENDRAALSQVLERIGLAGYADRSIGTLSAGQFQRMLFARLILQDAPLILLDEPFNALDQRTVTDLLQVVHDWHGEGRTVIAVLHDIEQIRRHFPETLLIAGKCIAAGATADVLTIHNLDKARAAL